MKTEKIIRNNIDNYDTMKKQLEKELEQLKAGTLQYQATEMTLAEVKGMINALNWVVR